MNHLKHLCTLLIVFAMTFSSLASEVYGLSLPNEAAGFVARTPIDNEKEEPGLGYYIPYEDAYKISTVSVFIYNQQLKSIPSGISPLLRKEAEKANNDVLTAQPYSRVLTNGQADEMEGVPYIFYKYAFPAEHKKVRASVSYMYMMSMKNYFIKVRITHPNFSGTDAPEKLMMFTMQRIDAFMHQLLLSMQSSKMGKSYLH